MENSNISLAFRLNYLLGTKESKIKDLFPLEYEESKDLKLFEYYCDAKVLRYLCILRNSVFVDFAKYNKKRKACQRREILSVYILGRICDTKKYEKRFRANLF